MKQQITPIVLTYILIIGIITTLLYYFTPRKIEPFVSAERCASLKDCATCTTLDGCAWCSGTETCRPLTDGCPGAAEEVILQKAKCQSSLKLAGTVTGKDVPVTSDVVTQRRLTLIKKYVDRIIFNYEKLDVKNKNTALEYIKENISKLN